MTLKSLSIALSTTALIGLALPVMAQDKTGTNVNTEAAASPAGGAETLGLASQLYAMGVASGDALTVLTAAKLAMGVEVKEGGDIKKTTTGDMPADDAEGAADAPVDAMMMLAKAKELAADDEILMGLIADAEAEGSRGRIGGAVSWLSRLPSGQTDVWEIPFYGNSYAEIAVVGDGDANLDVAITDENGNVFCYDVSWSDSLYCNFTPSWDGYFYVTVQNMGRARNSYYLMTN
ncbi:hypothetical protein [Tabrizicola sp.]|uniref:hypothetical protein n=1 Tax=Tabrizicola sp. TaxID=2005166 RepID=UPI00286CFBB0|nr:hypothetical protein [Tabrizicola sp.]